MKNPLLLCSIAGALLVILGLFGARATRSGPATPAGRPLARVDVIHSPVELRRGLAADKVSQRVSLHRMDTITTGEGAEAVISFENGEEIRLLANSRITIDKEAGRPLIILKAGDFLPEKILESDSTARVLRQGERRRLADDHTRRQPTSTATAATGAKKEDNEPRIAARKNVSKVERLTAEYIQDVLKSNRGLFFKCYTHLLQKSPSSRGDATIALTIDSTGRIKNAEIASSQIPDPEFRDCLSTAAKRVEFKTFAGDPVQAIFPLRFE